MAFAFGNGTTFRGIGGGTTPSLARRISFNLLDDTATGGFSFDSKKAQLAEFCKSFDFNAPPRGENVLELVALLKEFADANRAAGNFNFKVGTESGTTIITISGTNFSAQVELSCKDKTKKYFSVHYSTNSVIFEGIPGLWEFHEAIGMLADALFSHGKKSKNAPVRAGEEIFNETE